MRARSEEELGLLAEAARVMPGGVLGRHKLRDTHQFVFSHGRGAHVFDVSGREYIDYTCAGGAVLLGYDHPGVTAAIQAQAARAPHFLSMLNEPAILYARDLVDAMPMGGLVRFCCSGAEGTFYAMRLARAFTGKQKVLKFEGAYHGHHDYAMWSYNRARAVNFPQPVPNTAGMPDAIANLVLVAPYGDLAAVRSIASEHAREIACLIVEPVQRMMPPPAGFLEGLKAICAEFGIVLVFDETVTGFRLAPGGAQERYGVIPDLAVYGKSAGGGLPLAAVMGRPEIMRLCDPKAWSNEPNGVFFSGTLYGNPIAAAAGRAFLKAILSPNAYPPFLARAAALKDGLRQIVKRRALDAHVFGEGPMWHLVFGADPAKTHMPAATGDQQRLLAFHYGLIDEGVFVRPGGGHYFSMATTDADVEHTLTAADRVLASI
jgi:glutamate-1-semialdehyde 2,1-aminomutase